MTSLTEAYDKVSNSVRDLEAEFRSLYPGLLKIVAGPLSWIDGRLRWQASGKPLIEEKIQIRISAIPHFDRLRRAAQEESQNTSRYIDELLEKNS